MGLLDKLWDDTFAGPRPDSGLGKLRKHSYSLQTFSSKGMNVAMDNDDETTSGVTRSKMIVRPPGVQIGGGSAPSSPDGSTPPVSPFSERQHRMHARRQVGWEQGDQLVLMMCEL